MAKGSDSAANTRTPPLERKPVEKPALPRRKQTLVRRRFVLFRRRNRRRRRRRRLLLHLHHPRRLTRRRPARMRELVRPAQDLVLLAQPQEADESAEDKEEERDRTYEDFGAVIRLHVVQEEDVVLRTAAFVDAVQVRAIHDRVVEEFARDARARGRVGTRVHILIFLVGAI